LRAGQGQGQGKGKGKGRGRGIMFGPLVITKCVQDLLSWEDLVAFKKAKVV